MPEGDPVADALDAVQEDGAGLDGGDAMAELFGDDEPIQEGAQGAPDPQLDDDHDDAQPDDDSGGWSLFDWAARVPEGSHLDFDARDWWDPETGGRRRLAFHLSDAAGDGLGYPNGLGVLVGLAEEYFHLLADSDGGGQTDDSDGGDDGAPAPQGGLY